MTKFAEYGFNKSHTAAYAVVTYQTAWLKAHHCSFIAATLSSDMDNTDSVKIFYDDAIANKIHRPRAGRQCLALRFVGGPQHDPLRAGGRSKAPANRQSTPCSRRATPEARSRIYSTSACAWTSAWSTAVPSKP